MKVIEQGADRTAFVHITVEGQVNPLEEYGQYVDARDKALCCYVAVEEGHKLRIKGNFSGPTLVVAHDCTVDGICRKANSYVGKAVQVQKSKKLDVDSVLYQTADGVIDTEMSVVPYTGTTELDKETCETIGTIELRVYITRQFDVEHNFDDARKYDGVQEDSDSSARVANYKDVPPQYQMTFEKNCSILEGRKGTAEKKKVYAKRPGKEPWAIFRFHYRTKESIEAKKMGMSFNPAKTSIAKQEAHPLELEFVPPMELGSKPAGKNDGDNSVRTSSPAPTDPPSTPTKGTKRFKSAQPKVVIPRKPQIKPETTTTIDDPISAKAPSTDFGSTSSVEAPVMPKALLEHLQSTPTNAEDDASGTGIVDKKKNDDNVPTTKEKNGDELTASTSEKVTKKAAEMTIDTTEVAREKPSKEVIKNVVKKGDEKKNPEMGGTNTSTRPMDVPNEPKVLHPADIPSVFESLPNLSAAPAQAVAVLSIKDYIKSSSKTFTSPLKKAVTKPASVDTTTPMVPQKPVAPPAPAPPMKRGPEGTLIPPSDLKRIKADVLQPLATTQLPRSLASSPSPRTPSIEAQVAEQRKRLEAARKKRAEMAKKKAAVDEKLAPYKQRMAEELERLRQETVDEEAKIAIDEEDYLASEAMLAECEQGDGGF